ncbi:MAG: hypothetical protein APF84_06880 [Gracilibacter sp. BRH_c7a]|nr:MAG: hypothetical protein APF84_06880 [Gracilibacter sp. BRH_c7a]
MLTAKKKIFILAAYFFVLLVTFFLTVCAIQQAESAKTLKNEPSPSEDTVAWWSPSIDCLGCHTEEATSVNDASYPVFIHYKQGFSCATCHADNENLAKAHEGATDSKRMPTKLKTTKVEEQACLSCHNKEDLVEKTCDVLLVDSEGTSVNPHELSENESHALINCNNCHSMHSSKTFQEQATLTCLSCHHAEVFECGTCHVH